MFIRLFGILIISSLTLSANGYMEFIRKEESSLWVSLFALAIVSILFLFIASEQLSEANKKHKLILSVEKSIEQKQQFILEFMGEKIESSTKNIVEQRIIFEKNDFNKMSPTFFKQELEKFKDSEELLLDATHELTDFLKLKSNTLLLKEESYKLNNVINETFASAYDTIKKQKIELIYDVSRKISEQLKGDSRRMEQILSTVLKESLTNTYDDTVSLSMDIPDKSEQILIEIHNPNKYILKEEIDILLENYTLGEAYKSKEKLYMYVAYKLIILMGGKFEITSSEKEGTYYKIKLPYVPIDTPEKNFDCENTHNRALIVVKEEKLAKLLERRLATCGLSVEICNKMELDQKILGQDDKTLLIVDKLFINHDIVNKIKSLHIEKQPHVVVLRNIYENLNIPLDCDMYSMLNKPLLNKDIDSMSQMAFKEKASEHIFEKSIQKEKNIDIKMLKETANITRENFKQFSHLHLLIVEDNHLNQKILKGVFSHSGMTLTIVNNGLEALKTIKENSEIDLILMDTNMPVMDGYEATKKIREFRSMKMLPIIAMESIGFNNTSNDFVGINAFLHKPFKIGELYTALITYTSEGKSTVKNVINKLTKYKHNKKILDIQKGISHANTAIFYKEVLKETFVTLEKSDKTIEDYIMKAEYKELKLFSLDTIALSDIIGAAGLEKILIEIMQTFDYKQENRLKDYISLYKKELKLLKFEINEYLKT